MYGYYLDKQQWDLLTDLFVEDSTMEISQRGIYIGKKSVMGYVLAVVTQFNHGEQEVFIKARGKAISRAVDVAEIVRNRFLPDAKIANILTKTEELDSEDGTKSKVSAIEIKLCK